MKNVIQYIEVDRIIKLLITGCALSTALSCFILLNSPSNGYEISLYSHTPAGVWLMLLSSLTICFILGIFTILANKTKYTLLVLATVILTKMTILYLPYIRGYIYTSLGDTLTHIGLVRDIISIGSYESNYYPIIHTLLAILAQTTGVQESTISKYFNPIFAIGFILFIYVLSKCIFQDQRYVYLASLVAGVSLSIYFHAISPNGLSVLYLALIFAFLLSDKTQYKILLILTLILMPFFHILTALILVLVLIYLFITQFLLKKIPLLGNVLSLKERTSVSLLMTCIEGITLFFWILSFRYFYPNIRIFFESVLVESTGYLDKASTKLDKLDLNFIELCELSIKTMGDFLIYLLFTLIAGLLLLKNIERIKKHPLFSIMLSLNILVILGYVSYLFNILPGGEALFGERIILLCLVFYPVVATFTLMQSLQSPSRLLTYICVALIITASLLSMLNLYTSPYISKPNQQVTQQDINGMTWLISNKSSQIDINTITLNPKRYCDVIFGQNERKVRNLIYNPIPDHFDYPTKTRLGESYSDDKYVVIVQLDKILYTEIYKSIGRFERVDFIKLEDDTSTLRIYDNNGFEGYYVRGEKK